VQSIPDPSPGVIPRHLLDLRQPHGTPLTPNINNLPPGGNPIGTPMVKVD